MYIVMKIGANAGEVQDVAAIYARELLRQGKAEMPPELNTRAELAEVQVPAAAAPLVATTPGGKREVARKRRR